MRGIGALCIALVIAALTVPAYWLYLLTTAALSALVARSVGLVTGQTGLITLCQMSFAAAGGWLVSWMSLEWGWLPFPLMVLAAGAVVSVTGAALGLVSLRIRGVELAAVTLGLASALSLVLGRVSFPGTARGIPVIPNDPFSNGYWFYALAWGALLGAHLLITIMGRSRIGIAWESIRVSERATAALGGRPGMAKATSFMMGAGVAGVAGGLLAGQYGLLTEAVFTPVTSMVYFAVAVMSGASVLGGAVLAGVLLVFMPEVLRRLGVPVDVADALFALGAFEILRKGNGGIAEQFRAKLEDRRFRGARTRCDLATAPDQDAVSDAMASLRASRSVESGRRAPILRASDVTVSFGRVPVLERVDLVIEPCQVHALIGANGAGKSTLINAMTGFLPDYSGSIADQSGPIDDDPAWKRARRGVRRTFQQSRVIDSLTVEEYLRLAGSGSVQRAEIETVREFFGLPDGNVPIRLMDIGSRRILEVAAAVAPRPQVVLLDEPASSLGEEESRELAKRLAMVPTVFGCSVLLVEHDVNFVRIAADAVTVLDRGHPISSGEVAAVLSDPRVIAAYLGKENAE